MPSSNAMATSLAVPTPASTITGTDTFSLISTRFVGFRIPSPLPIGAARGMTALQPMSASRRHATGSSVV
ncbi:hypothetical protein D3C83_233970 [compost metagenome]